MRQDQDEDTLQPMKQAVDLFSPHLAPGAEPGEPVSPVAHPLNIGIDAHSAPVAARQPGKTLWIKALNREQARWHNPQAAIGMAVSAGGAGIAPSVVSANPRTGVLLQEHLGEGWRHALVSDLRHPDIAEKVIAATRALHALPLLAPAPDLFERIEELVALMENGHPAEGRNSGSRIFATPPEGFSTMRDYVTRIGKALAAAGRDQAPCHVENSLSNVMIGPRGEIRLVDFDRATNDDPLSDLAALCNEYCRTEEDIARAVEIYAGRADPAIIARVKLHMIASAFYWGLWGIVSDATTRRHDIEFRKYGENQLIRCLSAISRWDTAALIRAM